MIMEKALKMEVVGPASVMILSGQFPSEMLMRAPLCTDGREGGAKQEVPSDTEVSYDTWSLKVWTYFTSFTRSFMEKLNAYLLSHLLNRLSFL